MRISMLSVMSILAVPIVSVAVTAAPIEYSAGHGDIGLALEDGELELHYHFGNGAILDGLELTGTVDELELEPGEAFVRVSDTNEIVLAGPAPFLGAESGDSVWVLPQSNTSGVPFLGIASEELDPGDATSSTISLSGLSGPGEFALWQVAGLGGQAFFWQSIDGLSPADILTTGVGAHDHFNYGFSAPGVYDLELTATADLVGGGTVTDVATFRFAVGAVSVPEPGTGVLAIATIPALFARRRSRRNHAATASSPE